MIYIAKKPDIPDVILGKTVAEATDRIREAILCCIHDEDITLLRFVGIQQIQA